MPLPHASSLCGACTAVCPVRIPIPELLVHWRQKAAEQGLTPAAETMGLKAYAKLAQSPELFRAAGSVLRHVPLEIGGRALPVVGGWMQERSAPKSSKKSFLQMWKEGIE